MEEFIALGKSLSFGAESGSIPRREQRGMRPEFSIVPDRLGNPCF